MKLRSRTQELSVQLIAIWLSVVLIFLTSDIATPQTRQGIQCPTAVVQKVVAVTYTRDCCGKLVPVTTLRAPHIGEKEFVQCHCAEKKAAQTHGDAEVSEQRFVITMGFDVERLVLPSIHTLVQTSPCFAYLNCKISTPSHSPETPPPQIQLT